MSLVYTWTFFCNWNICISLYCSEDGKMIVGQWYGTWLTIYMLFSNANAIHNTLLYLYMSTLCLTDFMWAWFNEMQSQISRKSWNFIQPLMIEKILYIPNCLSDIYWIDSYIHSYLQLLLTITIYQQITIIKRTVKQSVRKMHTGVMYTISRNSDTAVRGGGSTNRDMALKV